MIFITTGTQLPFDRLIKNIDYFYADRDQDVFAQIGHSEFVPENIEYADFLTPPEADSLFNKASLIIAHAGMGSILTALKYQKPILIMPRKASLGEHRNEHQTATANWVKDLPGVTVANDEIELIKILSDGQLFGSDNKISKYGEDRLIGFLQDEINS